MCAQETSSKLKLKILVVDDEETILKLYKSILESAGHTVVSVLNGKDAISKVGAEQFDLVFLDLKLPDIEGTKVLKEIKEKIELTPVIIVTANPSLESTIEAIRAGSVYDYIIKPFGAGDLSLVMNRVIEKAELTNQNKRLVRKLETMNKVLQERVDELEEFAKTAVDYEKKIAELEEKVSKGKGK